MMDRDSFLRALGDNPEPGYVSTDSPAKTPPVVLNPDLRDESALIPNTQAQINQQTQQYNESRQISERGAPAIGLGKYIEENQRANVILDVGAGDDVIGNLPWTRMMVARRKLVDDQRTFLEQSFGKDKVRMDKEGKDFIIEIQDPETGKPRDIKLNEEAITVSDIGALLGSAGPEIIGSILGLGAGRGLPLLGKAKGAIGFARDIVSGAIGSGVGGGLSEAEGRLETGTTIQPTEIAERRARSVPTDIALGYLFGGIAKGGKAALQFGRAPFSFARTEIQNEGLAAAQRIADKTKINLLYNPGEATGFPGLIQSREYLKSHPAGASRQLAFKAEQEEKVKAFKDYLFGSAPSDEAAGAALVNRLQQIREWAESLVEQTRTGVAKTAESRIRKGFGSGEEFPTVTGEKIRQEVLSKAQSIKGINSSNYQQVYDLPEASEAIIPTKPLQSTLNAIKAKLPDRAKQIEEVFYDTYGNPMTKTSEGRELLPGWTHDELKRFLTGGFDEKMPLNKMVEMRDLLYDKISSGEALQGIPNRYLKEMGGAITKAIDEGVTSLPSGELKTRLAKANEYYKNQVLKLNEAGIEDLFATVKEGTKFVEPQNIVNRLKSDPAKYQRTLDLIGKNSPGAEALRQSIRTDVLMNSTTSFDANTIDGSKLLKNLNDLRTGKNTREIFNDVFGSKFGNLEKEGVMLGSAQGTIPIEEAKAWMASFSPSVSSSASNPSIQSLNKIMAAEQAKNKVLANKLVEDATAGKLDTSTINPEKFVSSFVTAAKQSDLDQVMSWVRTDPVLTSNIQQKTLEKFFGHAGPKTGGKDLKKLLDDKSYAQKLETVVGPDSMELIKDYIAYEAPREFAAEVAGGTGQLVKGSAIGKLVKSIPLVGSGTVDIGGEIEELVKIKALSIGMSNPAIRKWLSSEKPPIEFTDLAKAIVISEPFIKSVSESFSVPVATEVMKFVKQITNPQGQAATAQPQQMSPEEFQNRLR